MPELLTAAQMRALEAAAIDSGAVTGLELMERAGRGVVDAIFAQWPELGEPLVPQDVAERGASPSRSPKYLKNNEGGARRRALVLCGPGNNGGDGYVVARLLAVRGWEVEVCLLGDPARLPPDARVNYERWCEIGVVAPLDDAKMETYAEDHPGTLLAVDALWGIGLSRPFEGWGRTKDTLNFWALTPGMPRVVAVDLPSGLDADSGRYFGYGQDENPLNEEILAELTVSFHRPKLGHVLAYGPLSCGALRIIDIGLGASEVGVRQVVPGALAHVLQKSPAAHKYDHGHALVLSGPMGRSGAARLAARGALRVGAGLVTVGAPGSAMLECACQLTAIMLRKVEDADVLAALLQDTRITALCLGPGLGLARARELVPVVLQTGRPVVLDADALTAFAGAENTLFEMLHAKAVLTPHGGEFARLFPDLAEKLAELPLTGPAFSKLDATREAAKQAGAVVVFKGPDTVIAAPDGRAAVHAATGVRAAPWLATAGSGDVLSGLITGLLARGLPGLVAAEAAAWLHVEAARAYGPGLIAEDLPEVLPQIIGGLADIR